MTITKKKNGLSLVYAFVVLAFLAPAAVFAQEAALAAKLSPSDIADVKRAEAYLDQLKTVEARFIQMSSDGGYAEGDIWISRPGNLKIEYDPPLPVLIVTKSLSLVYYDKELKQVTYVPLSATPAHYLVREKLDIFGDELTITDFRKDSGILQITIVKTEDPLEGSITLVFGDKPLVLRQWIVQDAQDLSTSVTLMGARYDGPIDDKIFEFRDPNFFSDNDNSN